jgi:DNA polymerase-3 subunit gamma/tau
MLTREAFNALLKTLEEPPAHVIFIFATTEIHKVPATILSRCQCYDFRRISLAEITANLGRLAAAEEIRISSAALSWIAEAGDGSMRDAQSVFDHVISYAGMNINDNDVEEILGLSDRKYLFRLSASVLAGDAGACLIILEEAYLAGLDMKHFYQMLLKHFRNMLLVKIASTGGSFFDIPPEQIEMLKEQTIDTARETLQRYVEILIAEEDSFRRSQEARLKLETIVVRMAYLEPIIPIGEIMSTIEAIEQKLQQGFTAGGSLQKQASTAESAQSMPSGPVKSGRGNGLASNGPVEAIMGAGQEVNLAELGENFKKFVKKENPILGAKTVSTQIVSFAGGTLTLGIPKGYLFLEDLSEKSQKEQLEQIAQKFFNEDVTIKFSINEVDKTGVNNGNGQSKANNLNNIKREAMNDPLLQKVMDEFTGAEIVEIKARTEKSR